MKKVAVLFSGGLDSTYLVWKNLKDGNIVYPFYVDIENNKYKTILEKNRTNLLVKEFQKEFNVSYDVKLHDIREVLSINVKNFTDALYFKQVPVWITSLLFLQSTNYDEIQIGYVSNDDAISYLDDIKKIYESYQPICDKLVPLTFPIIKLKKYYMACELPKNYLDLIISCENPRIIGKETDNLIEYEPCCECVSCETVINTNYYGLREFPKIYHNNLIEKYVRNLRRYEYTVHDKNGVDYYEKFRILEPSKEPYQLSIDFDNNSECETIIGY